MYIEGRRLSVEGSPFRTPQEAALARARYLKKHMPDEMARAIQRKADQHRTFQEDRALSDAEALEQAKREGLSLPRKGRNGHKSATGYAHVRIRKRDREAARASSGAKRPFLAMEPGNPKHVSIGAFASAAHAALVVVRWAAQNNFDLSVQSAKIAVRALCQVWVVRGGRCTVPRRAHLCRLGARARMRSLDARRRAQTRSAPRGTRPFL